MKDLRSFKNFVNLFPINSLKMIVLMFIKYGIQPKIFSTEQTFRLIS
jgi:hypothetical protein